MMSNQTFLTDLLNRIATVSMTSQFFLKSGSVSYKTLKLILLLIDQVENCDNRNTYSL